jgi:thiamine-phosphate pyrophosphorylase
MRRLPFNRILAPLSCQTSYVADLRNRLATARLYLVCDAQPDAFLRTAIEGGVDIVQLRIKDPSCDDQLCAVAERFARCCADHGALFILNDRPDLVRRVGADGVHIGQDDMAAAQARELVGPGRLIGLSTHSAEQVEAAARDDVDYIGVGPVHATPTKPGRPAVGLDLVRYAADHATVPFFAIGGIDQSNVAAVVAAGASRVAVVRALTRSAQPRRAARALRGAVAGEPRERVGAA